MLRAIPDIVGRLERALELHRKGLRLVPLAGKVAVLKDWPDLRLDESGVRFWFGRRSMNIGVITGEPLVVIDTDNDSAENWVQTNGIDSPVIVQTGSGGFHRYFRCPAKIAELRSKSGMYGIAGLDLKGWRSYVVAAGSVHPHTGNCYEYLPGRELHELSQLPAFNVNWLPGPCGVEPLRNLTNERRLYARSRHIRDVRRYIRSIPSIQGQNGSNACFRVACLLYDAGFSRTEILAEMRDWNRTCAFPPWSEKELHHKLDSAIELKHRKS